MASATENRPYCSYFPAELVKTALLPADRNYLLWFVARAPSFGRALVFLQAAATATADSKRRARKFGICR